MLKPRACERNGDGYNINLKLSVMGNNYGLIDLTENELKEQNGGFCPDVLIMLFTPTIEGFYGFMKWVREGIHEQLSLSFKICKIIYYGKFWNN